ncbi:MAG: 50S ribosomal protein L4 [Patescibacteria group bacterium]
MKKYPVYNTSGEKVKELDLNAKVFGVEIKEGVVHQVAISQMANSRVAIAHAKDKSEVHGGGAKPWRQKGTGRARHGSSRSPIWVGGGVTFGPTKDRNFSKKVNKKMKTRALFMCLSDKVNDKLLTVLDKFEAKEGKTKEVVEVVKNLKKVLDLKEIKKKVKKEYKQEKKSKKFDIKNFKLSLLLIIPKHDKKAINASKNLTGIKVITADSLNVVDLLKYEKILLTEGSLEVIAKTYLK